jgi:hypothetical protein
MAKFVTARPEWLKAEQVTDLYSVSVHGSKNFEAAIDDWQEREVEPNNGYRLYDSPEIIRQLADAHHVDLAESVLFFYEIDEQWYDEDDAQWYEFEPPLRAPDVVAPSEKTLEGYDVVAVEWGVPGCSPLCCNHLATVVETNEHCLLPSLERARRLLTERQFDGTEPGPFQIFAVYTVPWP